MTQEALAYARSNCQSFNVLADRKNLKDVRALAHLDESDPGALQAHKDKLRAYFKGISGGFEQAGKLAGKVRCRRDRVRHSGQDSECE